MMKVPEFKTFAQITKFAKDLVEELDRTDKDLLHSHKANKSVLLFSPNKSVYELTVEDDGTVVTELIKDNS